MNADPRLFTALLAVGAAVAPLKAADVHWNHGESLAGDLIEVKDGHLVWNSNLFTEPLKISLQALRRVDKIAEDRETKEPFSIRMADGTHLYGRVTALDAETLSLSSGRFGNIRVVRSAVAGIVHLQAKGVLFAAPTSTAGWTEVDPNNGTPKKKGLWQVVAGAGLKQAGWNRSATLPIKAPDLVEMRFTLSSTVRPEFKLELKAADKEHVVVETWDDEVVLQGRVFRRVEMLKDESRRVTMSLFWHRSTGLCALYSEDGHKLAETNLSPVVEAEPETPADSPEKKKPAAKAGGIFGALLGVVQGAVQAREEAMVKAARLRSSTTEDAPVGFTLLNKGPDLTLESLRIREWNGTLPADITAVRPRVELADGRCLKARVTGASASGITLSSTEGGAVTTLPWEQVLAVEMDTPSPFYSVPTPGTELWFADGEWVSGDLQHLQNGVATIKTGYAAKPVSFKVADMRRMILRQAGKDDPEVDFDTLDMLTIGKQVLHGHLEAGGDPQPRWKPVGGLAAVAMVSAGDLTITRALDAKPEATASEVLFYLQSGDVLPGRLRAIDATRIDLDSSLTTVKDVPAERLQAIQFGGEALNLDGFEDDGWRRVRGGPDLVKREGKAGLALEAGGSWGHPYFMQVNEIAFKLHSNGFTALRVRLFCDGVDPAGASTSLLFGHMGSEVCFGLETSGDQMDRQFRLRSSGPMPVRIAVEENAVEVFFNDVSARKITLNSKMRSGSGIIIEPFSLWGNGERDVKISDFSARIAPGRVVVPVVDLRAKEHALTVPRFRKDDPPRQALLAANGDLLRGVIEAATAEHFAIRSGLETIQVPRDRVRAVVWLVKPVDAVSAAFEARDREPAVISHWLLLNNGGRLGLNVDRFAKDAVIGTHELLGACRVPLKQVHVIRSSTPPDNAAMAALRDWKLKFAPEPVLPESGGQSSPLLGQDAKTFKLPLLAAGDFDLSKEKGKVIVLDFWATWCGPCIKSLPDMISQMSAFDAKKFRFIGVNQAEAKDQVKSFLEARGWKFEVALDASQRVGQQFGVEGIPHTVIIGPDGKIAYVKTGYEPDGAQKIAEVVKKLLGE